MVFDIDGDQMMDVLFQSKDHGEIMVALGQEDSDGFSSPWNFFGQFVVSTQEDPLCGEPDRKDFISTPNSNAFVDIDGDCLPDLFLTRQNGS